MLSHTRVIIAFIIMCLHVVAQLESRVTQLASGPVTQLASGPVLQLESRPLNILFVVAYFPSPSQTYILNIMTGLIDKGHNVKIFSFLKNDSAGQPDVAKYSLMDHVIYEKFPQEMPECDIVFCQSATLGLKIIKNNAIADWIKDKKLVVCLRGLDITGNRIKKNPAIYRDLFSKGHLFLPVCNYFKDLLLKYGCDPNKIVVYHSAINCDKFFFKERMIQGDEQGKVIRLVSVCRLVQKKGLEFAIKAIARVAKTRKNVHFTIVGSGHLQSRLEQLVKKLGITDKVTFFGWATQEQVVGILDESHIFLLPSITSDKGDAEGIANALKEAMSMGLISIGTMHAGTPELIKNGVSGFLVPEGSGIALARKIKYIIKYPELWKSIGLAARKKIENEFEIKKSIEELEKIFYELLGSQKNLL